MPRSEYQNQSEKYSDYQVVLGGDVHYPSRIKQTHGLHVAGQKIGSLASECPWKLVRDSDITYKSEP